MKESEIQKLCLDYLKSQKYFVWKNPVGGMKVAGGVAKNPSSGSPDIMAIKDGKFYGIEVKTKKGVISKAQYNWLKKAHDAGAVTMVVRSLEDLIYCLDRVP